jgi:transposase
MGAYYVGLDVHSQETVFVIPDEAGTVVPRGSVPTTPEGLGAPCREHQLAPGTTVGLETGTAAFYVARELAALQLAPVVVDAHEVRRKAHRPAPKSDRRDAFEVCDGVRRGLYRAVVHIPSPAISNFVSHQVHPTEQP